MKRFRYADLYFVAACCLAGMFVFFAVIMPKVQANRETRDKLDRVVLEAQSVYAEIRRDETMRTAVLRNDPWVMEKEQGRYFQDRQDYEYADRQEP